MVSQKVKEDGENKTLRLRQNTGRIIKLVLKDPR